MGVAGSGQPHAAGGGNGRGRPRRVHGPLFVGVVAAGVPRADDRGHRPVAGLPGRPARALARDGRQGDGVDGSCGTVLLHLASALCAVVAKRCRFRGRWRTMSAPCGISSENTTYAAHRATTRAARFHRARQKRAGGQAAAVGQTGQRQGRRLRPSRKVKATGAATLPAASVAWNWIVCEPSAEPSSLNAVVNEKSPVFGSNDKGRTSRHRPALAIQPRPTGCRSLAR